MSNIATQGFVVNDRPVYSPIDPKLTTFDPQALNEGVLSAYKVADTVERFNAFKALNSEVAALRQDREAAAHANFQNTASQALAQIQLRPQQTDNTAFADRTLAQILPYRRTSEVGMAQYNAETMPREQAMKLADLTQREEMQPVQNEAALNEAQVRRAKADSAVGTVDAVVATDEANVALAANKSAFDLEQQADQQKLAAQTLADQLANAKTDADRRRIAAGLDLQLKQSQITENLAKAERDRALALNGGTSTPQIVSEFHALQTSEKDILERPLPSQVKMKVYLENKARDPLMTPDPEGERLIVQLRGLREAQGASLAQIAAAKDKKVQALNAAKAGPPVELHFNPVGAVSTPAAQGIFDTPATAATGEPPVLTPEDAAKLPVGTLFKTPDGRVLRRK